MADNVEERRVRIEEDRAKREAREARAVAAARRVEAQRQEQLRSSVTKALRDGARHRRYGTGPVPPSRRVAQMMHAMFDASVLVLQAGLEAGDLRTATFIAGRYLDAVYGKVATPIEVPEGATPKQVGDLVVQHVLAGKMDIGVGHKLLRMLESAAGLSVGEEIEELKQMIREMGGDAKVIEGDRLSPAWLRLASQGAPMDPDEVPRPNGRSNGHG